MRVFQKNNIFIILTLILLILSTIACSVFSTTLPSTPAVESYQKTLTPVSPEQSKSGSKITNHDGVATFEDPISGNELTVEFKDENTRDSVSDIEVWFISNGPQVLVITNDPAGEYAPVVRELSYDQLSNISSPQKLSSPAESLSLGTVILLIKVVDAYQTMKEWQAYLSQFPELENWKTGQVELCMNPLQLGEGVSLLLMGALEFLPLGNASSDIIEGLTMVFKESVVDDSIENISEKIARQSHPAIYRVTLFSFQANVPKLIQFEGLCLDWLDLSDPQSSLDWLVYGINNQDMYAFAAITDTDDLHNAFYIEGYSPIDRQSYLNQLALRLNSGPKCDGITAQNGCIQVWTSNWVPPWKVTENCYVDCNQLRQPWESEVAAFGICNYDGITAQGPNYDREWRIRGMYLNTPENLFVFRDYQMAPCENPDASIIDKYPAPTASNPSGSCPGIPEERMEINQRGYVCTKNDSVMVRKLPLPSGEIITRLAPGTKFVVIDGPSCGDWAWWMVETDNGIKGWMAEGGDKVDPYFICPLP